MLAAQMWPWGWRVLHESHDEHQARAQWRRGIKRKKSHWKGACLSPFERGMSQRGHGERKTNEQNAHWKGACLSPFDREMSKRGLGSENANEQPQNTHQRKFLWIAPDLRVDFVDVFFLFFHKKQKCGYPHV